MKAKNLFLYFIFFVAGLFPGRLLFRNSSDNKSEDAVRGYAEAMVWTCSMHPQIRQEKPGLCPLCAMDLIPVKTAETVGETVDSETMVLSNEAAALANIQTTRVGRSQPVKEVHLYGAIQLDERRLHSLVSHVSGRIEKLYLNFTGETIRKGQTIAEIYSPDLLNAQQELLEAVKIGVSQPALLTAAREKLRQWRLTDEQIAQIEQSGSVSYLIDIKANRAGVVVDGKVETGDYVNRGSVLFDVADLSSVWALFEVYEADLPYLKKGDKVNYTLPALPGKTFSGSVAFIDPVLDKTTRTAKVRVETGNPRLELKPGMYANAIVRASLKQAGDAVVIPKTAVLWTGKRSIVYVKQMNSDLPAFKLREIELGPSLGEAWVVLSGLGEGEEIVTSGAFIIDAAAQLEGKQSMMN